MKRLFVTTGEKVLYRGIPSIIVKVISINTVSIEEIETNIIHTVNVNELQPYESGYMAEKEIFSLTEKEWEKAKKHYEIIKPILANRGDADLVRTISKNNNISVSTIYRWIKLFDDSGLISSLSGKKRKGGAGKSRLSKIQDEIINDKIHAVFLNSSRKSITKTIREIELACDEFSIKPPHPNTIRNRIKAISEEEKIRKRYGLQEAKYKFSPIKAKFPGAEYPLSVVQIDHTLVDIILVDEHYRKPFKRPWLTLAIDVYSRMVVGFYLSFDTPGFLGTGICIANSILPKEMWLGQMGIDAEWPCWGIMDKLHLDNAKEFRSNMLNRVCLNYGINIDYRPVGSPHWGGHIERLLGTFSKEIHNLPGTTFSSVAERKKYESEKNASFTLPEFEKWLAIFITKIYHNRKHSEINTSPLERYKDGIIGNNNYPGRSIPPRINDERKVRLDFLPMVERSVQEYGVVIDHIYYYHDVLREYIHDSIDGKKRYHIFKRDPRDISLIYFFDPKREEYYEIPYRDASLPPMSVWEYREIRKKLKEVQLPVDEKSIFGAFREMNEIEEKAVRATKKKKRKSIPEYGKIVKKEEQKQSHLFQQQTDKEEEILPFDDLDDEAFN